MIPLHIFKWDNDDYLSVGTENLLIYSAGRKEVFSLASLISIKLSTKKKLAPLIMGAVLACLALINILLSGAGLIMMGVLSIGLLILYVGMTEYWVISLDQFKTTKAIWIAKNKCDVFPQSLINIIDYRVSKGFFPPFYTITNRNNLANIVSERGHTMKIKEPIYYYLTPPKQSAHQLLLKVDLNKIATTLHYIANQNYLALGKHQLNKDALLNIEI